MQSESSEHVRKNNGLLQKQLENPSSYFEERAKEVWERERE